MPTETPVRRGLVEYTIQLDESTFARLKLPVPFTDADLRRVLALLHTLTVPDEAGRAD